MLICHFSLQKRLAPTTHCQAEPAPTGGSAETHPSSLKMAMFSQVPPAGFSKSLLPTQSHNSPELQCYKHSYIQSSNPDGKIISLNSYTVIASKCFVFVLRCLVSPLSLVFSQLNLWFAFSSFYVLTVQYSTHTVFSQANLSLFSATNGTWCIVPAIKMSGTL